MSSMGIATLSGDPLVGKEVHFFEQKLRTTPANGL